MFSYLKRLWSGSNDTAIPKAAIHSSGSGAARGTGLDVFHSDMDPGELGIVKYPPFDQGIPVAHCDKLVQSQQELIARIFRTAGVSRQEFAALYEPPIRNLARHVHLLPATSTTYFRGTGGMFRMSLEVALHSLQAANGSVFPTAGGVERRFVMQPKWSLATFLAGLCSQTYRTVNSMAVLTRDNAQWAPLLENLYDWCSSKGASAYFVRWLDETQVHGAQASTAYSVSRIIPHEILQYLAEDNNQVVQAMTAAVAGVETNASENPISRLVAPVITRVIEEDLERTATNYGHLVIGAHLEPHLIDAMRRLVRSGKWIPNNAASGGRLWIGQEGIFLDWQPASTDISNLLARDAFAGVPKDPETLADLLIKSNLLELPGRGGRYWTITTPVTYEAKDGMVKLRQGTTLLPSGFDMAPYATVQLIMGATSAPAQEHTSAQTEKKKSEASPSQKSNHQSAPSKSSEPKQSAAPENKKKQEHESGGHKAQKPQQQQPKPQPKQESDRIESENPAPPESGLSQNADKLLASLKQTNGWLLAEVLKAFGEQKLTGRIVTLPHGTGITHEELNAHGIPVMELLEELALKGWLWTDKTRTSRRIHVVDVDGQSLRMVILKPEIAAGLGLPVSGA